MRTRYPLLVLLPLALFPAACHKAEVTSYRVPKEKDPEMPGVAAPAAPAPAPTAPAAPGATPGATMADTTVPTAPSGGLIWTAPAGWQAKPATAMRKGSFTLPGEGGATSDLSITAFGGAVGGEVANVNRWRGQVSLPPLSDAEAAASVTRLSANGLAIGLVDCAGTGPGAQRILGAIVPQPGITWFFKLIGPEALVASQKPAFLEFLKTVKAPGTAAP